MLNNNNGIFLPANQVFFPNTINIDSNDLLGNNPELARRRYETIAAQQSTATKPVNALESTDEISLDALIHNVGANVGRIGTGLIYLGTHAPEMIGSGLRSGYNYLTTHSPLEIGRDASNYIFGDMSPERIQQIGTNIQTKGLGGAIADDLTNQRTVWSDVYNAMAAPYNATTLQIAPVLTGDKTLGDFAKGVAKGIWENPVDAALDVIPFVGGLATRGVKAATKTEKGLAAVTAKGAKKAEQARNSLDKLNKLDTATKAKVFEAAETGKWTDDILQYKNDVQQFSKDYSELVPDYAKVDAKKQSIIQKYARDNNIYYQDAERDLNPVLELLEKSDKALDTDKELRGVAPSIKVEETAPKFKYDETDSIIKEEFNLSGQSPKVQKAIGDLFDPEEIQAIKDLNGRELYTAVQDKLGSPNAAAAWFQKNGIGEVSSDLTGRRTIIGGTRKAKYNPKTNEVILYKDAMDEFTQAHETSHALLKNLDNISDGNKAAKELKDQIINEFDKGAKGITETTQENFANAYTNWLKAGKPLKTSADTVLKRVDDILNPAETKTVSRQLEQLASSGDRAAQAVLEGNKLFNEGKIFPITHAMESADEAAKAAGFANDVGGYAGRFSRRGYGLTSYEQMAKALEKPDEILENQLKQHTEYSVAREMIDNGTVGGQSIAPVNKASTVYINRKALENGNIRGALANPVKELPSSGDFMAIDKNMAAALKDQINGLESVYKSIMGDIYATQKSTLLSQGTYLAGNAITGATNTLLNSGVNTLNDVVAAIGTRGKLAKQMGIYRRDIPRKANTKIGQVVQTINDKTGGQLLRHIDGTIQNSLAEIAANASLRRRGIASANRLDALDKMSLKELGDAIVDTKRVALLNTNRTILPKNVTGVISTVAPFWQWSDTAAQSALHLLKTNPLMSNVVLNDILGTIAFDQEMQNRLNLGVSSDKPLVSYRFDDRTGKIKEAKTEFIPMMNTITLMNDALKVAQGKAPESITLTNTALGEIINAVSGKNRYGKPLTSRNMQVFQGRRYRRNPETGRFEVVEGGTAPEVLSAVTRGFFGLPNMINKTAAPFATEVMSELSGTDYNFYRPYDDSLFGSIQPAGVDPRANANFLVGGNPERPRTGRELINALSGGYESDYYPERQPLMTKGDLRSMLKSQGRHNIRAWENINR